jgi:iron-sulfur cluster assembly protein
MALDEPKSEDEVFDEKGTKFIIDKDLLNQAKPINVDFVESSHGSGFKLTSALAAAEGDCGSSCGSGSSCGC